MSYFRITSATDGSVNAMFQASRYDPSRAERRMTADKVVAGGTQRQAFPIQESDREISMSGNIPIGVHYKLLHMYQMEDMEFLFADGRQVWKVLIESYSGLQERSKRRVNFTMSLGVLELVKAAPAVAFAQPATAPSGIIWPVLAVEAPDGVNDTFTLPGAQEFASGYLWPSWNGRMLEKDVDYSEVGNTAIQLIDLGGSWAPPQEDDAILFWGVRNGMTPQFVQELLVGAVDGSNVTFTTQDDKQFYPGRTLLMKNGVVQVRTWHYLENVDRKSITVLSANTAIPTGTDRMTMLYFEDLGDGPVGAKQLSNVVWPVQSATYPDDTARTFELPDGRAYKDERIATFRSGLLLTPVTSAEQQPQLQSVRILTGDPPADTESVQFMFEPA